MSIAAQIGRLSQSVEITTRANEFLQTCRALSATENSAEARDFLHNVPSSDRTLQVFEERSAVPAASMTDSAWASPLAPYQAAAGAFAATIRNSAFDRVLADEAFMRVPPQTQVAITLAAANAVLVGEQAPKAATLLQFTSAQVAMSKIATYLVLTSELMEFAVTGSLRLLGDELRKAVGFTTDNYFLSTITSGITAIPSAGSGALAIRADIQNLMDAVVFDATARLYYVGPTTLVKRLATAWDNTGSALFPGLTPTGGVLGGVPLIASDAATAGTLTLFDASQIAVTAADIELDRSKSATLQLDSAPDSPPLPSSSYVSLFAQNKTALRAERFLGAQRLRTTAVAQISGMTGIGNSPS